MRVDVMDSFLQVGGALRDSAVDHHQAIVAEDHRDVPAIAGEQNDAVGKLGAFDRRRSRLAETQARESQTGCTAGQVAQQGATVQITCGHGRRLPRLTGCVELRLSDKLRVDEHSERRRTRVPLFRAAGKNFYHADQAVLYATRSEP